MPFLTESLILLGALAIFFVTLGKGRTREARVIALVTSAATVLAAAVTLGQEATLFDGAYRVDLFSQILKLAFAIGFVLVLLMKGKLPDIQGEIKPEYYFFLTASVSGLMMLVSSIDVITLVVALELSAFPLYVMVAMRREREGQRTQMESAIKYIMFGIAANGIMLFGLSYLFGLTGTTSLRDLMPRLQPFLGSPVALVGLAMTFCGLYYKLAVFPFHFWTPDVYQGSSNETAGLIASLPKIGAVAVLVRFVSLASPGDPTLSLFMAVLAGASMFYGNLVALMQNDLKRLLGFSGIAHAGYALLGFVAMDRDGYTAAIYYIFAYALMVIACFVAICRVSRDGTNVAMEELAGLHRRSPMLAVTLGVGIFALAGIPPFAGFTAKLALLKAALNQGHLALVVIAVVNTVIAIYYYLAVVRETFFRDPADRPAVVIDFPTRALCVALVGGILALGILPQPIIEAIKSSL
ncbi:MAG TPA: NADH-quinone oxidoreductase subunit N [Verrucomicrobiae bacterium]|nr:NADH-quinone oxidoreductase subunit N [Verrucomicrobiae bacterium]